MPTPDGGKANVYLDNQPPTTVDSISGTPPLSYQIAFIKTGLDPAKTHTIKIVVLGKKRPKSCGTSIRHVAFEYSAESYKASAGFCSIAGKEQLVLPGPQRLGQPST